LWLRRSVRCFSLSPARNMIEFSRALSRRRTLPPEKPPTVSELERSQQKTSGGWRGLLASCCRLRRFADPPDVWRAGRTPGKRKPLRGGKFPNNGSRGNRVKWETYSVCVEKKTKHIIHKEFQIYIYISTQRHAQVYNIVIYCKYIYICMAVRRFVNTQTIYQPENPTTSSLHPRH